MPQGSQVVSDNPGAVVRAAINGELAALYGLSSGSAAPSVTCAYMFWWDTTNNVLKIRDAANANWVIIGSVDQTNKIWQQPAFGGNAVIASASTADLGSTNAATINITGTTTITSFGSNMKVGQVKLVTFSGALTLTYNAGSMILPTAANINTAAGDACLVECVGSGNYQVMAYTRADGTPVGGASYKVGSFTRDTSLATGSQSITGIGFKPKCVEFIQTINTGANFSWGFSDGTTHASIQDLAGVSVTNTTIAIVAFKDGANFQSATVSSMDSDGFTLAWTKTASPTGTATIIYKAHR